MPNVDINWAAVLVAALINMVTGSLWYSKALFAKPWIKLTGKKDMEGGGVGYAVAMAGALVQAWIMAHFVVYASSNTFWEGVVTGFWLWLGFVAITTATNIVFEGRPWKLWQINAGYFLVVLLINGGLLAAWH
jgi:hypothetical protein